MNEEHIKTATNPKVSVIMNCLNGEKYLREAIDSVYAQTYTNWEIIFWDNASIDRSPEIAKSYDDRLKYFRGNETIPLGAARKKAIEMAEGELIAFLDCDDVWFSDKLERQVRVMSEGDCAVCYGGVVEINAKGEELRTYVPSFKNGFILDELLRQFDMNVPTIVLKRAAMDESKLTFDENVTASEEYCLFMQLAAKYPFCVVPQILAGYRVHEGALTNRSIARWAEEREYTLNLICKNNPGIRENHRAAFEEAYARARYYRARYHVFNGEKFRAMRELRKNIFVNYKYFVLFLLLLMPMPVWNFVHELRSKRSHFS